jgi:hypothetical protein
MDTILDHGSCWDNHHLGRLSNTMHTETEEYSGKRWAYAWSTGGGLDIYTHSPANFYGFRPHAEYVLSVDLHPLTTHTPRCLP